MANRSPPIPLETGSIKPRVAFAAMAASTALPPRLRMSIPTSVAAGTLVQTMPWRARTSDRVAKFFPVGLAAQLKESFQSRAEISTAGFTAAAIAAALGIVFVLFSLRKKQG